MNSSFVDALFALALRGEKIAVLYFYPKDSTPGCTVEAQEFRDLYAGFVDVGALVVGVSRDSEKSHENFRAKQNLPFPLLSDRDEAWCAHFGVIKPKKLYGKEVRGIERSTFVLDRDGQVLQEWRGVKAAGHAAAVLDFLRSR